MATVNKLIKELKLLRDPGVVDYLTWIFSANDTIRLELAQARRMSEIMELGDRISEMKKLKGYSGSDERSRAYNGLVDRLNSIRPDTLTPPAWNQLREDVYRYFTPTLNLSIDCGEDKDNRQEPGYLLNVETGALSYRATKSDPLSPVCTFGTSELEKVKEAFPTLFEGQNPKVSILGRPREEITPHLLTTLMALAPRNPPATFHIKASQSFVVLFRQLGRYMQLKDRIKERSDTRSAELLVSDITKHIKGEIATYLADQKNTNPKRKAIMTEIQQYLDGKSSYDALKNVVNQHEEKNIFKRYFSRTFDTLKTIEALRASPSFRETITIMKEKGEKEARKREQEGEKEARSGSPTSYLASIQYVEERNETVRNYWEPCRVTVDAFTKSLDAMSLHLSTLDATQLPRIPMEYLPLELQHASNSAAGDQKNVISLIQDMITKCKAEMGGASTDHFVQSRCALFQNHMEQLLRMQSKTEAGKERYIVSAETRRIYTAIGVKLTDILISTDKNPEKKPVVNVHVLKLREEINRLITLNVDIITRLAKFQERLSLIHQAKLHSHIELFLEKDMLPRQAELRNFLTTIESCPDAPFDQNKSLTKPQEKVIDVIAKLNTFGTGLTDKLSQVLLGTEDDETTFESTDDRVEEDQKARETFNQIMDDIIAYSDTFVNTAFAAQTVIIEQKPTAVRVSEGGLFAHRDAQHDHSNSNQRLGPNQMPQ